MTTTTTMMIIEKPMRTIREYVLSHSGILIEDVLDAFEEEIGASVAYHCLLQLEKEGKIKRYDTSKNTYLHPPDVDVFGKVAKRERKRIYEKHCRDRSGGIFSKMLFLWLGRNSLFSISLLVSLYPAR